MIKTAHKTTCNTKSNFNNSGKDYAMKKTNTMRELYSQKMKIVKEFYNSLTFETAKKTSKIVTENKKLESTSTTTYKAVGIALYPAFKASCSNATNCVYSCISFTGVANIMKGSSNLNLSNTDKASLKRLWLFNNASEYFYQRAKIEIMQYQVENPKILFREITSECIDYSFFQNLDGVTTYGYFKDSTKITSSRMQRKDIPAHLIYSWNEKSRIGLIDYCKEYLVPIAVVVPKKVFKKLIYLNRDFNICEGIAFHNGDNSDMNSTFNFRIDKINIHLLSEKTARYSKQNDNRVFLDSYKKLFEYLSFEVSPLTAKVFKKLASEV